MVIAVSNDGDAHAVLVDVVLRDGVADEIEHLLPRVRVAFRGRVQQKCQFNVAQRAS